MSSANASLRHTAVGVRSLAHTQGPETKAKVATKSPVQKSGPLDRVERDEDGQKRRLFEEPEQEEREGETLAGPPGHRDDARLCAGEAFRRDAKGRELPPTYVDVDQGNLADAWLLAACAAVAHAAPVALLRRIRRRNEREFAVELGKDVLIITPEFPTEGYADPMPNGQADSLWVALVEKAYARREGGSYAHLETGNAGRALEALTGKTARRTTLSEHVDGNRIFAKLRDAKRAGAPMVLKVRAGQVAAPLVADHHFAILDVIESNGTKSLRVYNPWGSGGGSREPSSMVHDIPFQAVLRDGECIDIG
ncbi:MAG: C2 family cysteine protease [Myxococcota bacterium]